MRVKKCLSSQSQLGIGFEESGQQYNAFTIVQNLRKKSFLLKPLVRKSFQRKYCLGARVHFLYALLFTVETENLARVGHSSALSSATCLEQQMMFFLFLTSFALIQKQKA